MSDGQDWEYNGTSRCLSALSGQHRCLQVNQLNLRYRQVH